MIIYVNTSYLNFSNILMIYALLLLWPIIKQLRPFSFLAHLNDLYSPVTLAA